MIKPMRKLRSWNIPFIISLLFIFSTEAGGAEVRARLLFVGDIMAHKEQLEAAERSEGSWDFVPQFKRVKPLFQHSLNIGNLETVFAGKKPGFAGYPSFNTPDELADALSDLGIDVVTLANNHILDRGSKGAARTLSVLESADIKSVGVESGDVTFAPPLEVDYSGIRIVFVSYSYGSNRILSSPDVHLNIISNDTIIEGLRLAETLSPDFVVACMHWGNEYQYLPTKRQREAAALCFEKGADLVIGTHPHVLQPIEINSSDKGYRVAAYSLGNFVSFQRTEPRERSGILAVDISKQGDGTRARIDRVAFAPTWVSSTRTQGRRLIEVVYAGESGRFNHAGLPAGELKAARKAGKAVLEFLGTAESADIDGFYVMWDMLSPDWSYKSKSKAPLY